MRGTSSVMVAGNATGDIAFGQTDAGVKVCSLGVVVERKGGQTVLVRANVFGDGLVGVCERRLFKGSYVVVRGELMHRSGTSQLEVRAEDIVILTRKEDEDAREKERREG